jgi:hypothetical protein
METPTRDDVREQKEKSMTEVFTRYGEGGPRPDHVPPKACTVRHPDAGGQCPREAVGEVWALPFCEVHGREAELAYREEISESVGNGLEALLDAENQRHDKNRALLDALRGVAGPRDVDYLIQEAAMRKAFPPEELAANTDPDTLRFDYEIYGRDTPSDWWHEARIMAVRFMRQAQAVPILEDLELIRERATVQQLLADRDMGRRARKAVAR